MKKITDKQLKQILKNNFFTITDKQLKQILKNNFFTIEGKKWRVFKKSQYYQWIFAIDEDFILSERVREYAGQFIEATKYLNLNN